MPSWWQALAGKAVLAAASLLMTAAAAHASDCAKLDAWVARGQAWSLGQDFNRMQSQRVRQRVAPIFHDDVMREVWGEDYRSMSESRRADIFAALTRCPTAPWARAFLAAPFSNPPEHVRRSPASDHAQWQLAIEAVNRVPLAEWERRQQQWGAAVEQAAQQRADMAAQAPARAQLAQEIAAAQQREREARALRAAQEAAERSAAVRRYQAAGPFTGGEGAAYLNALHHNDREALLAFDRMFAAGLQDVASLYKGSGHEALMRLFQGPAAAARYGDAHRKVLENYSLVIPVAVAYIVYYEHAYPTCMDARPHEFGRTIEHEWVTKNALGQVLKTSPAWTERQVFRINDRFMEVWKHKGSIEQANTVFLDTVFGRPGAIRVADAMGGVTAAMHQFPCDSEPMQRLDRNLLNYFNDSLKRIRAAVN